MGHVFGYVEHQENSIYGLGSKLTIERKNINGVSNNACASGEAIRADQAAIDAATDAIDGGKIENGKSWYVPHYAANTVQHAMLSRHII